MAFARHKSVAGIPIPDTTLCNAATDLLELSSPEFLCTHCLRTYIFGSLAIRSLGRVVVDEEAAFCGAVLHDLGLDDRRSTSPAVVGSGQRLAERQPGAASWPPENRARIRDLEGRGCGCLFRRGVHRGAVETRPAAWPVHRPAKRRLSHYDEGGAAGRSDRSRLSQNRHAPMATGACGLNTSA
jgi:hypothetical protein